MKNIRRTIRICIASFLLIVFSGILPVVSAQAQAIYHPELLVDEPGLLDEEQFETLNCKLFDISQEHQCNVAVVVIRNLGNYDAQGYANQYYVSSQYGYEATDDGILLLVAMDQRSWALTRDGFGYDAFTDAGLQYISKHVKEHLSDGDYYEAFNTYADLCDRFLKKAESGAAYDNGTLPRDLPSLSAWAVIVGLGGVLGVGITLLMKMQLKSVRSNPAAGAYIRDGSFHLEKREDVFLYSRVTRVRKPKDENRSGRSSSGGGGGRSSGPSGISGHF